MKLLNIHIDDYGKLSNFELDFTVNPSIIFEDNGWGKSTLASFIRVMFYGFEGETKKKVSERERYKYKPWNKGNYGGRIIFEADGKEYELTRHFGDKDKDDTGSLIDISTMLNSDDFSLDKLGEQLFELDEESFVRTVFVGQGNIDVRGGRDSIGDGIAAKIGNLTDATDDIYNYDKVHEMLMAKSRELKYGHKQGIINDMENQKTVLLKNVSESQYVTQTIAELENLLQKEEMQFKALKAKEEKLVNEQRLSGRKEAFEIWKGENLSLLEEKEEIEAAISKCTKKISKIPSSEEIQNGINMAREVEKLRIFCMEYLKLNQEATKVARDISESDIDEQLAKVSELEKAKKELSDINYRILTETDRENFAREQRMADYERRLEKAQNDYELRLEGEKSKVKNRAILFVMIGIVSFIMAAGAFVFVSAIASLILGIIAIGFIALGIINFSLGVKNAANRIGEPEIIEKPSFDSIGSGRRALEDSANRLQIEIDRLVFQIKSFFEQKGIEYNEGLLGQTLYSLKEASRTQSANADRAKEYEKQKRSLYEMDKSLREWINDVGFVAGDDYIGVLGDIEKTASEYERLLQLKEANAKRLEANMAKKPSAQEGEYELARDNDTIVNERNALATELENCEKHIKTYVNQLGEMNEKYGSILEDEEFLKVIDEKLDETRHKYDIILETVKYMENAKAKLTSRYIEPISKAFNKYYGYICENEAEKYSVDANINVTKEELGERRNSASLSQGYRDLVDVALRMSIVDAMYTGEKPFIVLDDPFVNLDTNKLDKAKCFLDNLANDYQVIYFTCHKSRA